MTTLLFILGSAATGKTTLAKKMIKNRLENNEHFCLMDKDVIGEKFGQAILASLGADIYDRDSPTYKQYVRDLEYQTCLNLIKEQLELGISVIAPGPWTKEINNGALFSNEALGIDSSVILKHLYIKIPNVAVKERLLKRADPRDKWKLNHWAVFEKTLIIPDNIKQYNVPIINEDKTIQEIMKILKLS